MSTPSREPTAPPSSRPPTPAHGRDGNDMDDVVAPVPDGIESERRQQSDSFTVQPPPGSVPDDGGGALPGAGGPGDTTHPEGWADERSVDALRERVRAAGLEPGDRSAEELVTLLKQEKPSNRLDPRRHAGPGADGGRG